VYDKDNQTKKYILISYNENVYFLYDIISKKFNNVDKYTINLNYSENDNNLETLRECNNKLKELTLFLEKYVKDNQDNLVSLFEALYALDSEKIELNKKIKDIIIKIVTLKNKFFTISSNKDKAISAEEKLKKEYNDKINTITETYTNMKNNKLSNLFNTLKNYVSDNTITEYNNTIDFKVVKIHMTSVQRAQGLQYIDLLLQSKREMDDDITKFYPSYKLLQSQLIVSKTN
jgi:hypothetical protein